MTFKDQRVRGSAIAAIAAIGASLWIGGATPAAADLPILTQTCTIAAGLATCPQLDPKKGKLVSIDISYSMTSKFALTIVGDHYAKTDYTVTVWHELDTQGGDIGSFYVTATGAADVAPKDIASPTPNEITVSGSHTETVTDPVKLNRFAGTSVVPISAIAEPATGVGKEPKVGFGSITSFYRLSSTVNGTVTLRYQPILIKPPVLKLPKQKLPGPPYTVPPYPKPKQK